MTKRTRPAFYYRIVPLVVSLVVPLAVMQICACSMDMDMNGEDNPDGGRPPGPTPTCMDKVNLDSFSIDVPAVTLSGKITVNGQIPKANTGTVTLVRKETGDSLILGRTADPMYTPKLVLPGTYDVVYSWNGQASDPIDVPRNTSARIKTAVEIKENGVLDIDLVARTISGKITVNGKTPTANTGQVILRDPKSGDSVQLGRTGDASYTPKLVIPSTYEVVYSWNGQSSQTIDVPRNSAARIKTGVDLTQNTTLDVDIVALSLSGKITVNGKIPTANTGSVILRDPATGDSASLGRTADPNYTTKLIVPSTYDIVYSWNGQSSATIDVPRNSAALVKSGVALKESTTLDVDVPAVSLAGKIFVNGQIPTATSGTVTLREPQTGDSLVLGRTADPNYTQKLVVPGSYNMIYNWNGQSTPTIDVPRNTGALLRTAVSVKENGMLDVNIPAVTLSGKITVSGQIPTSSAGTITLREAKTGDSFYLGKTSDPMYLAKLIVPGTYEIFYSFSQAGSDMVDVPRNQNARIKTDVVVKENATLDVDIPALVVKGNIRVNGKVPVSRSGQILLSNPAIRDLVQLGRTGDEMFLPKLIVPAPYNVLYSYTSSTDPMIDVPRNSSALLYCRFLSP